MKLRVWALIAGALILIVLLLTLSGKSPVEMAGVFFKGSLGGPRQLTGTLKEMTPLLLLGVGVFFALRAGLFNIGIDGQFVIGAMAATTVALAVPTTGGLILGIILGACAGALWALPAGLIRAYRGGHEVITTIMLNNVAYLLVNWATAGPLKDPAQQSPTTKAIGEALHLPAIKYGKFEVSSGLLIGLVLVVALWYWLRRTVAGYELCATGANPTAALCAGIKVPKVRVLARVASGAIGGLAGAIHVFAFEHRFYSGFSPGYGFDSLGVALLAGAGPLALIPSGILFGLLAKGSTSVLIEGVPRGLSTVLVGLVLICFAAYRYRVRRVNGD